MDIDKNRKSLFQRIIFFSVIMFFFSLLFLYFRDYTSFSRSQRDNFDQKNLVTISFVDNMARILHWGIVLQDKVVDSTLKMALERFCDYYDECQDPSSLDLKDIGDNLSFLIGRSKSDVTLSIINRDAVLIYSTDDESLGLDFKNWPPFYEQIMKIFDGGLASVDPWSRKLKNPDQSFKFGYIPTRDGKYLLSIGLFGKGDYYDKDENFSLSKLLVSVAGWNRNLVYSAFINRNFKVTSTIEADFDDTLVRLGLSPNVVRQKVIDVFTKRQAVSVTFKDRKLKLLLSYVDLKNDLSAAEDNLNMVSLFIYSTSSLEAMDKKRLFESLFDIFLILSAFILGCLLALIVFNSAVYRITRVIDDETMEQKERESFFLRCCFRKLKDYLKRGYEESKRKEDLMKSMIQQLELEKASKEAAIDKLSKAEKILSEKVMMDKVSKLPIRDHTVEVLKKELALALEDRSDLSVLMIDIDKFRSLNEVMGYAFGDRVLEGLGKLLSNLFVTPNFVGRYGADEFVIILPGESLKGASIKAEMIREDISNISFDDIKISVSIAVTSLQLDDSFEDLLVRLENFLEEAKTYKKEVD